MALTQMLRFSFVPAEPRFAATYGVHMAVVRINA